LFARKLSNVRDTRHTYVYRIELYDKSRRNGTRRAIEILQFPDDAAIDPSPIEELPLAPLASLRFIIHEEHFAARCAVQSKLKNRRYRGRIVQPRD